jgi:hypothetical protein
MLKSSLIFSKSSATVGIKTILSPSYANEISRLPGLSFSKTIAQEVHSTLKAFDPFLQLDSENETFQDAVRMRLTRVLGTSESRLHQTLLTGFS